MEAQAVEGEKASASANAAFGSSAEQFDAPTERLQSAETEAMRHSDLEQLIEKEGREELRRLFQDHLRLRARREAERGLTGAVVGAEGEVRTHKRVGTERRLMTVFGPVVVERIRYEGRAINSLQPMDAELNVPTELYSHRVRRRVAEESLRGRQKSVRARSRQAEAEAATP